MDEYLVIAIIIYWAFAAVIAASAFIRHDLNSLLALIGFAMLWRFWLFYLIEG